MEKVTKATKRNSFKDDSIAWCSVLTGRRTMIDVWYVYSVYGMSMYSIYIYILVYVYVCVVILGNVEWSKNPQAKICFKNPIFYLLQDDYMRVCMCV